MENKKLYFDINKVWLAEMKYYSKEDNGIEYSDPLSYAFVVDLDEGEYANPFDFVDDLPVFERVPYANYTSDGVGYGTKVRLIGKVDKTGPCFVLCKKAKELGFVGDMVSSEQLADYMIIKRDKLYFKDRKPFLADKLNYARELCRVTEMDDENHSKMVSFLAARNAHIRLIK